MWYCPLVGDYPFNSKLDAEDGEEIVECYLWHRGDFVGLAAALSRVDWGVEFACLSVNLP